MPEKEYELESDEPVCWVTNTILRRDDHGEVRMVTVPDDESEEVTGDARDN